jgi:hypothetical protein
LNETLLKVQKLSTSELYKLQLEEINSNSDFSQKQKKAYKQLNRLNSKFIKDNFGKLKNNFNLANGVEKG